MAEEKSMGELIDKLDNLAHAVKLPLKDSMHVDVMRRSLPELVREFKSAFVHEFGENPWEGEPR